MKILLVNGSPRRGKANSRIVLDSLRKRLGESHEYRMAEAAASGAAAPEDLETDFIVLAFPLYIDSLHSRLLSWLMSYEKLLAQERACGGAPRRIGLIAVANCGFHEGIQNKTALDIVSNFCARSGIEWRGGLGIGTGEMLGEMKGATDDMFIKRPVSRALDAMAERAGSGPAAKENLYASHAFPWVAFKAAGHMGWRKQAKANGVGRRAMRARPFGAGPRS
jgi:hypothetical protein